MSRRRRGWGAVCLGLLILTGEVGAQTAPAVGTQPRAVLGTPKRAPGPATPAPVNAKPPLQQSWPQATVQQAPYRDDVPVAPFYVVPGGKQGIVPVGGGLPRKEGEEDVFPFLIQLTPPGPQRLFRLESEEAFRERVRRDAKDTRLRIDFPPATEAKPEPVLPERQWGTIFAVAEPNYVCYGRLWFQQRNFERQGWDLGVVTPGISAGLFYVDVITLPIHWALDPLRCWECSAGLCLPGDPAPLLWYPCWTK